jgi:putative heme-binding domain-containing protein
MPGTVRNSFLGAVGRASCHEINGRGSSLAADLSEIGRKPAPAIATGLEHELPPRRFGFGIAQRYADTTLNDGRSLQGLVKNEDSFAVVLQAFSGEYHLLARRDIRTLTDSDRTLTPTDTAQRLSAADREDLVAYLARGTGRPGGTCGRIRW